MGIYDSLLSCFTKKGNSVLQRIHKEILCQNCRTLRVTEYMEVFFPVWISVSCVVGADYLILEDLLCSFIKSVCESV